MKALFILFFQFSILLLPQLDAQVSSSSGTKQHHKSLSETDIEIAGAMTLGSTSAAIPGAIRWSGEDFEGYTESGWVSLTTAKYGVITDIDGNNYRFRKIGDLVWMIDNLRATKYNNGDDLNFSANNIEWDEAVDNNVPTYTQIEDETNYTSVFGLLYNGHVLDPRTNGGRNICPSGWHVPSQAEFEILKGIPGGGGFIKSSSLKARGTLITKTGPWSYYDGVYMTNVTGFDAMPAGFRNIDGGHVNKNFGVFLWSSTIKDSEDSFLFLLSGSNNLIASGAYFSRDSGMSIRCVRD